MSYKSKVENSIRCSRNKLENSDFCFYHNKSKIYFVNNNKINNQDKIYYEKLDELNIETLLGIYDSWKEIPQRYIIKLDKYWDIRILVDILGNQLCASDMENPKPNLLHDPFTKRNYTKDELLTIKIKCIKESIEVYIGLKEILNNLNKYNIIEYGFDNELSKNIIKILEKKLRFRIINNKNSQNNYNGLWVPKIESKSIFEYLYNIYQNIPYQEFDLRFNILRNNEKKIIFKEKLDALPLENISINEYTSYLL
jgi:hypothetical protein